MTSNSHLVATVRRPDMQPDCGTIGRVNGTCLCCGRTTRVQRHHPGRRNYTSITVPACQDCHTILTIWDGGQTGERQWATGVPDRMRVNAGVGDILYLACTRSGWHDLASEAEQVSEEFRTSFFVARCSATSTAYDIREITPDDPSTQLLEIKQMITEYQQCQ